MREQRNIHNVHEVIGKVVSKNINNNHTTIEGFSFDFVATVGRKKGIPRFAKKQSVNIQAEFRNVAMEEMKKKIPRFAKK